MFSNHPWVAVGALIGLIRCQAQHPAVLPAENREALWQKDLKFFAAEFSSRQKDFSKLYPGFHDELAALEAGVGKLTDSEITLRLMRLVASANVGHTAVYPPVLKLGFDPIPLTLAWYSDGLAVIGASSDYAAALGTHVLRIGTMTPEQLLAAVAPYISHENDTWLKERSPAYMQIASVLRQVGAAEVKSDVAFTLAKPGGEPFTLSLPPASAPTRQLSMFDALHIPVPIYRKQRDRFYWYEYLADAQALYIQYNRCLNDPKLKFADFTRDLFAFADSHPVKRVVLDLRQNPGGSSFVIGPLKRGLKDRAALRSRVFVLIGPRTFSSAQMAAIEFRRELHATLVGEATGEKPNGYGEVKTLTLPNSGLQMQYSTKYFHFTKGDASALEPEIRASGTLNDALAGRDPVLEAALRP